MKNAIIEMFMMLLEHRTLKYYFLLGFIFSSLLFYLFIVIISVLWPYLLAILIVGSILLYQHEKKNGRNVIEIFD